MNNQAKIRKAEQAIGEYVEMGNPDVRDRRQTALVDLLADLQHWAASVGVDFDAANESAADHYEAER